MSLVVWLPLTKDLRQQGLANVTVTNYGATLNSDGKLGGCYYFDGTDDRITIGGLSLPNIWSYSCWIYSAVSSRSWESVIMLNSTGGDADLQLGFYTCPNGNKIQNTANGQYNASIAWTYGVWHHFCGTFDGSNLKTYIDGVLVNTKSITATLLSRSNLTIGARSTNVNNTSASGFFQGKLNDVRIYDHCLSPMEVKELSKGLVLHYPLNRQGWGQENLLLNTNDLTKWSKESTCTITLENDGYYHIVSTNTNGNRYGIYYDLTFPEAGTYTLSADVRTDWQIGFAASSSFGWPTVTITGTGNAQHVIKTITTTSENNKCRIYISSQMNSSGVVIKSTYIKNIKVEKGSIATPWCPNSSDTLATTMGLNSTIEYDCSGFCNNGTRTGTFNWTSDTPKYAVSTAIEKGKIISTDSFITTTDPIFSVALWFKLKSGVTYTSFTDLISFSSSSYSNQPFRLEICGSPAGKDISWFRGPSGQSGGFGVGSNLSFDTWYHTVLVSEGNKQYTYYLNGERKGTYNGSANSWTPTGNVSLGENIAGVIYESDFRIYATALSADDVKSLYQNSAYIDSSGNVYGAVHSEV